MCRNDGSKPTVSSDVVPTQNSDTQHPQDTVLKHWRRAGLVGCIDDPSLPVDLTMNLGHMDGFGRD